MSLSTPEMSFVQTMLAVKAASQKATMDIYNTSHGRVKSSHRVKTPDALNGEMNKINEILSCADLQFNAVYSPWERKTFWGVCNTVEDEAMKLQYSHGKNVVPFFYEIVDLLLEKDGRIYLNDAHNLAPLHRMKVAEGSLVIQKLALEKWLKVDRSMDDAYLIFGVRSLLELPRVRNWIMKRNLSRTAGNKATGDDSDIEKEENELAESQEVGESSMASRKRKLSRSSRIKEVESDDDDMEVDEEPKAAPTRSTRSTRSRSRP